MDKYKIHLSHNDLAKFSKLITEKKDPNKALTDAYEKFSEEVDV